VKLLRTTLTGLTLAALLLAGCERRPVEPMALRKVVFQSDWFAQAEHGGFYQALAKGYYREAGLDVVILTGGPGAGIKLKVAKGDADFGMNRGDDAILAISRGLPLMMVMATLQNDPQALLVHAESPVQDFPDLQGRTVTAAVGMTWIPFIQQKYGIKFGLVPTSYGLASFLADRTVIQQCFLTSEPYFARQKGVAVRVLPLTASGYNMYHTVICRRELIRRDPGVVRAFVTASIRGWNDYLAGDPAPAHQLILDRNRDMMPGQLAYSRRALIDYALVAGRPELGEATGRLSLERIQREIDLLRDFGVLEKPLRAAEVATTAFLPPLN
jgi:NitT/TauT family transport system substrate-binding protein